MIGVEAKTFEVYAAGVFTALLMFILVINLFDLTLEN